MLRNWNFSNMKKSELKKLIRECIKTIRLIKEEDAPQESPHASDIKSANVSAAQKMVAAKTFSQKDANDALKIAKDKTTNIKRDKNAKPEDIQAAEDAEDTAVERVSGAKASLDAAKKKVQAAQDGSSID